MATMQRKVIMLVVLLIGTLAGMDVEADAAQISFGTCTPQQSAERGQCVHIASCPYLADILKASPQTPAQRELLSKSQCGLDNRRQQTDLMDRILVCCPQSKRGVSGVPEAPDADGQVQPGNVLPGTDTCGFLFGDRIVGGTNTTLWEFPWMVLLRYKTLFSETYSFRCGGALINSRYVLTAAHCLASDDLDKSGIVLHSVRLGEWDTRTDPDCETQKNGMRVCAPNHIDIEVEKAIIHEQFVPKSVDQRNDIALLRLKRSVSFTDYVRPICLPTDEELRKNLFVGYTMDVAGWGLTETMLPSPIKLKISVSVWNLTDCQDKYTTFQVHLNNSQVCAGGKYKVDTCGGDSGGPLMASVETGGGRQVFYIAGITSYGTRPCGLKGWPGVYTRTGSFIDWIQQKLEA